jgi:lipid-A-disaccharide synthase
MIVLLPFEVDFYRNHGVDAEYYGNPVLDSIAGFETLYRDDPEFLQKNNLDDRPVIALLAGSRKQEIHHLLPEMMAITRFYKNYQFVVAGAPSILPATYETYLAGSATRIIYGQTYELLKHASAAIVTSGTATLETALLRIPEVVVYKTSRLTFFIGNFFVKIKFFSLVNLILDKEAVKELLQKNLAPDIKDELDRILFDQAYRSQMLRDYDHLREKLGDPGVAQRVAARIYQILSV